MEADTGTPVAGMNETVPEDTACPFKVTFPFTSPVGSPGLHPVETRISPARKNAPAARRGGVFQSIAALTGNGWTMRPAGWGLPAGVLMARPSLGRDGFPSGAGRHRLDQGGVVADQAGDVVAQEADTPVGEEEIGTVGVQ